MGGFLIAAKETYELTEGSEWPNLVFWVLVVVMAGLSFANAVGTDNADPNAPRRAAAARPLNGLMAKGRTGFGAAPTREA